MVIYHGRKSKKSPFKQTKDVYNLDLPPFQDDRNPTRTNDIFRRPGIPTINLYLLRLYPGWRGSDPDCNQQYLSLRFRKKLKIRHPTLLN